MSTNLTSSSPQRSRIHPLVAGAAVAVILASATGIAAMTGLLPTSRAVTAPSTKAMPVAAQIASAPVASPQPNAEQRVTREEAPAQPRVHHHPKVPVEQGARYANSDAYQSTVTSTPRPIAVDPNAGEVVAVNTVQESEPTTGLGAVGGAVAGGLLGNQVGGGRGRILTTIAGAVGGGLAGNGIEHAVRKATSYQVQVRMQDGSYRNFNYSTQPPVQVGERVHVSGDSLSAS
ncbi:glycine zipper 2TM domain-containing protein [Paraburkholderia kirstenboschensis]|uniref:Glycine zipper 2TM domain-containing protein n=1 Tax=Paraburkholderia kirstenboschensis TaxID=1245436 RepID=A0ABZ0ECD3_9BURK|nr:glycine zipper 2TM domain-containing protein [Paraburkholderia kirstenboschensis]WOD14174.1 glycine zipper 2TM domain-containing protein [Paraburkholderia kirstenboschensis]